MQHSNLQYEYKLFKNYYFVEKILLPAEISEHCIILKKNKHISHKK